ncbi:hypothetical protein RF11_08742 [Thelohanellus kitauei]|uniref:Sortilin C-terminal domain-containing protein n=1 Tax=Thelohanellus kitauei TaxID=669202 RepID=A0A0C2MFY1_THEKT|nr:hypothetical protein RF11_08742 [Thelohanellus kitauei]
MNEGEVLVGKNDKILYHLNDTSYSFDMGNTWTELDLGITSYETNQFISGKGAEKFKMLTAIFPKETNDIRIVIVDFSEIFDHLCSESDYVVSTPGFEITHSCFQGRKDTSYLKVPINVCESRIEDLKKIISTPCLCTPEDFVW